MLCTCNNTDGSKFSGIALYYDDTYILLNQLPCCTGYYTISKTNLKILKSWSISESPGNSGRLVTCNQ